jgi:hypothetical protein
LAKDKTFALKVVAERIDCAANAQIVGGKKVDLRERQKAGVAIG